MTRNSLKQKNKNNSGFIGRIILLVMFVFASAELFAQDYEMTLNPRRLGNQLGVEVWVKTLNPNAPNLGDMSIPVKYNVAFLTGANQADGNQPSSKTDIVHNDPNLGAAPSPYEVIESRFHQGNGFKALGASVTVGGNEAIATLSTSLTNQGVGGILPIDTDKGEFVGMLRFDINNANALTDNDLAGFVFNSGNNLGLPKIMAVNGSDVTSRVQLVNPAPFTVRGITVLNPNAYQTINRYPAVPYISMGTNYGYPIYWERSGLLTPNTTIGVYGTQRYAYQISYSLDNGYTFTETGRVAESRLRNAQMTTSAILNANVSGMIDYRDATNDYYITTGMGTPIPVDVANRWDLEDRPDGPGLNTNGYGGVLKTIWKGDPNFPARSENARLRITQIEGVNPVANININQDTRPAYSEATRRGTSDVSFVLGRIFFVQLNGECQYLRTNRPFQNTHAFTVEAWINLNADNGIGTKPGIVASSSGTNTTGATGAWMLYLDDGKYPAFRVRAIDGTMLADIRSPQPLGVYEATDNSGRILVNDIHSQNWAHVAAVVVRNVVTLYVDGEQVAQYIDPNNRRPLESNQSIWVGINPDNSAEPEPNRDFLYAGIKEVKVWKTALTQDELRRFISGVPFPTRASDTAFALGALQQDPKTGLEIYANLQGVLSDIATHALQNYATNFNYFVACATTGTTANNMATVYRPDGSHIKLTSPSCGEGVSNLKGRLYEVRWASYGIGSSLPTPTGGTGDIMIQISRDGGKNWFDAIGQNKFDPATGGVFAVSLDNEEVEAGSAIWEPYNNVTLTGIANDIQGVFTIDNNYAKTVRMRISGTEGNGQQNVFAESGDFTVAPNFALRNNVASRVTIPGGQNLNITTPTAYFEAWIKPMSFPKGDAAIPTMPIIVKKDPNAVSDEDGLHYAFRLEPTGQLSFSIASYDSTSGVRNIRTAYSENRIGRIIINPGDNIFDSVALPWYHVGVYVDIPRNGTVANVVFLIDGVAQDAPALQIEQLGANIFPEARNEFPTYLGYEPFGPTEYSYFDGEMKEFRFWRGNPAGLDRYRKDENSLVQLYNFIQGSLTVRANELVQVGTTDYAQGLIAAYSMNGGSWVNNGADGTIPVYPVNPLLNAQIFGTCNDGGRLYSATKPYIKLVEPVYNQMVANTDTVRVRWVGFDYNRNDLASFTAGNRSKFADLGVSALGGGGSGATELRDRKYMPVASERNNSAFINAMILPRQVSAFEFQGTRSKSQYAALLNMGLANPDANKNFQFDAQGPVDATQQSGMLELVARANVNSPEPLEFANYIRNTDGSESVTLIEELKSEGPSFSITPPSNFTVRVLLEGYHQGMNGNILGQLGNTFETNALQIRFLRDNSNEPTADFVPNTKMPNKQGYTISARNPANRMAGDNSFGNVPFTLTEALDGRYFVVVEHQNYLPVMSAYSAQFLFDGNDPGSWLFKSGWDFTGWNGVEGNYMNQSQVLTQPVTTGNTHNAYAADGNVTADRYSELGHYYWTRTPLNFTDGGVSRNQTSRSIASMVGGDVVRDGIINAADRVAIGRNASMTYNAQFDLKGYGVPNNIDRTIVDNNTDKVSPLFDVQGGAIMEALGYPPLMDGGNGEEEGGLTPEEEAIIQARVDNFWNSKNSETFQSGIDYTVRARVNEVVLNANGNYVDVDLYIRNNGSEQWAMANSSFPIEYDPAVLSFREMIKKSDVLFDGATGNSNLVGYNPTYYAPSEFAKNPVSNVYSIEVDFDANPKNLRQGVTVPSTDTYLGTLRFNLLRNDASIFFRWSSYAGVLTVDGRDITRDGTFEDIKPIIIEKDIELFSPNGGEQIDGGTSYTISWAAPLNNTLINIEYSTNGGANWTLINFAPVPLTSFNFLWVTPFIKSNQCLVRLVDIQGKELARSKTVFSINIAPSEITRPSSDDPTYAAGSKDFIEWISSEPVDVYFEYSENGVSGWTQVTGVVNASLKKTEWTVRNSSTCNAVIRMVKNGTGEVLATSTPFRVGSGSLALTAPTKGMNLEPNSKTQIRWNSTGVSRFNLEYTTNAGLEWTLIAKDVQASTKTYTWTVPNVTSNNVLVRAVNNANSCLVYSHTEVFSIGTTDVEEELPVISGNTIASISPNPVSDDANIKINLISDATVWISIYDLTGSKVMALTSGDLLSAGIHNLNFNVSDLSSGVYVVKMIAGTTTVTKEFVKVK